MTPKNSPLKQIKDLLDLLSEKFDRVETEEVREEIVKRIERTECRLREGMRSLATGEGKNKLIVIGGDRKLGARLRLDEGGQVEAFEVLEIEAVL